MSKFGLLYEQPFTSTDTISVTHNLSRYIFNVRVVIDGDPALSQRELVEDIALDVTDPLDKMVLHLTGSYTGKIQLISEDTIQSPYYTVEEKLASQTQTPLAGTFPVEFSYGGNSISGRVLEYVNSEDSESQPYLVVGNGKLRAVSFGSSSSNTGTIGVYVKRSGSNILLHTISFTSSSRETDKPLDASVLDNDEIFVEQLTGTSNKPYIVCYLQTI